MTSHPFVTCLWFDGRAEQAAEFYTSVFPNSKVGEITRFTGDGNGAAGTVMSVEFELNGQKFIGLNGGPQFSFDEAISFQIFCEDQEEIDHYWSTLTEGGEEGPCGWLKDKFGVSWQVLPTELPKLLGDPDPEKSRRATEAMMTMSKFDLATIRAAHAAG